MVAKKNTRKARVTTADAHTIVLEDLRSQFLVFGEALQGLREHMDARFAIVDQDLGLVKHDLGLVKSDMVEVKSELRVLREDVELLKVAVIDNAREIKQLRKAQ